ncbi:glycosyltransferase [Steroidobacter agaridevorans]|uniref:glycosyltransferase n=1 Tax=Steroidobacter agaridevorans TaxID=2695856 RepID=UPI00132AB52A|nr:glycosyltransferase [Steroidobacter agaridevorans]GFE87066.1 hypothetical protein GCM10011488_20200 [Steroidobacter agaridevorans]
MRIGMLLPSIFAVANPANGVAEQARQQAAALERLGHTVLRLNPWEWRDERELDVLHFYVGGLPLQGVTRERRLHKPGLLVFSPIIDSNQPFALYRAAAWLGGLSPRFPSAQGVMREQARDSDLVICRSSHESDRMVFGLGVARERTGIVLNGCNPPPLAAPCDLEEHRRRLGLPAEFVLHISAFTQPRKNVLRLAAAADELGLPLVIAGRSSPGAILDTLERTARRSGRLHLLGFVDAQTRDALYSLCRVFCLPSIHEGTGLVALEAAARGANLVITKNGGPPDYFLRHADYVDPYRPDDIKRALLQAWNRPRSAQLREHILEHLTWDASARSLTALYREHLEGLKSRRSSRRSSSAAVPT